MFIEDNRYLNWSGRRYRVDQFGEVFDSSGKKIPTTFEGGQVFVELEWVLGKRKYLAALIVLLAFDRLFLPDYLLDEVEPLYVDGSRTNLSPINLIYRFKNGPLELEGVPGFYYIPMYAHYALSLDGVIINVETKNVKSWSIVKEGGPKNQTGGYSYTRTIDGLGGSKMLFLHRAMCLVFKPYDHTVLSLVVNHLDGRPRNNALENLEWATYQENNAHARATGLIKDPRIPVLLKDLRTNEVRRFTSATDCAKHLGSSNGYGRILNRIRNGATKIYEDMLVFKFDDGLPWPLFDTNSKLCRQGLGSKYLARNVFTGNVILFQGAKEGERYTGVNAATILKHAREAMVLPVGGYNFRYFEDEGPWPEHTERHLLVYRDNPVYPPDGIILNDLETGEESFFTSYRKAIECFPMSKSFFWHLIHYKKPYKNRYLFSDFKLKELLSLPRQ